MTSHDTGIFLNELYALYPNGIRDSSDFALVGSMWEEALKDYEYAEIHTALQKYFQNDTKGYVPTAGQLIELTKPEEDPLLPKDHEDWGFE